MSKSICNKKIIFYTYADESIINDKSILTGYWDTARAVDLGISEIKTTQMALLSSDVASKGYEIWIKEPNQEIYSIILLENGTYECNKTNRALRHAHNLFKLWRAGEFCE